VAGFKASFVCASGYWLANEGTFEAQAREVFRACAPVFIHCAQLSRSSPPPTAPASLEGAHAGGAAGEAGGHERLGRDRAQALSAARRNMKCNMKSRLVRAPLGDKLPAMIRFAITSAAFEAIAATLPVGSAAYEPQRTAHGGYFIWVERRWLSKLQALRQPARA
jgi:hypothetical protein